jgi:hypothetical protein
LFEDWLGCAFAGQVGDLLDGSRQVDWLSFGYGLGRGLEGQVCALAYGLGWGEDHVGQSAVDEFGGLGTAPATGTLAAETGVGQQAECGFDGLRPAGVGGLVHK